MELNRLLIRIDIPGFHHWPNAPEEYDYLKNRHRHMFRIEIELPVTDKDRELEFIFTKDAITEILYLKWGSDEKMHHTKARKDYLHYALEFDGLSCEMIADEIKKLLDPIGLNPNKITVLEDNENGAILYCN